MKKSIVLWALMFLISSGIGLPASFAQGLGATQLGPGLQNFTDCQNQVQGHREHLMADRLQAKLDKSTSLTPEDRDIWVAEIRALRQVKPSQPYKEPDPKNPQRYFLGLTNDEQTAINSMHNRFVQENNLACEKKYGGMTRYSPGSDQSGQARYEEELKDNIQTATDIATIPVGPLPSPHPKTLEQMHEERRAAQQANRQAAAQQISGCTDSAKGLRLSIMADKMQQRLTASKGLSAKERADFEADIKATRDAADQKLDYAPTVDPKNPSRAMMRLTAQDQTELITEFSNRYLATMQNCVHAGAPARSAAH
ncbi:MAG: hypothetical protein JWO91_3768 [Acidobacteriaceae bacterium]|nr:hypothetical protein [Acidobacteriaceae bacterium]